MAILNIFSSIFGNTATENYSHLTKGLCSNYLEGGGGVNLMGGGDLKLNYGFGWWGGGGLDVNLLNIEGGYKLY